MDIEPPESFSWLFSRFISLYNASDTIITPATIRDYENLFQFRFTMREADLLFRMKAWASEETRKLEKEA